ncbi:hypothetical protein C791_5050 [Amycolatopsis azurea DSM 43854]|uniref:Uncharacterized protein n=1 Tax=Amycolatopsis azurea DSM 43854 TaxID=1238180 RepID=M2PXF1_9PSEU|nr:hypothetical protein C791_5050 [Amycolatopsis azurea DSM 43854]
MKLPVTDRATLVDHGHPLGVIRCPRRESGEDILVLVPPVVSPSIPDFAWHEISEQSRNHGHAPSAFVLPDSITALVHRKRKCEPM